MTLRLTVLATLLSGLAWIGPPRASGAESHLCRTLRFEGDLKEAVRGDFDGDGLTDLALVTGWTAGRRVERKVHVFLQDAERGFGAKASLLLVVPPSAATVDAADVAGGPADDLVLCGSDGLWAFTGFGTRAGVTKVRLLSARTFFRFPPPNRLVRLDVTADLDADGRADLTVPLPDGYLVAFREKDGGFRPAGRVRLEGEARLSKHTNPVFESDFVALRHTLPLLRPADFDGDGRTDLLALHETVLSVFLQDGEGGFPAGPSVRARLPFLERPGDGAEMNLIEARRVAVDDVNRDGRADLIYVSTHGKVGLFSSIKTAFALFLGRKGAFYAEKPDSLLNVPGVALRPSYEDHDGDGDHDLLVAAVRTDLFQGAVSAVVKEVTVTYHLFLCGPDGAWARAPAFSEEVTFPTSLIDKGEVAPRALFSGDWNGDGLRDKVTVEEDDEGKTLLVFPGRLDGGRYRFADEPSARVAADVSADLETADLNGDGRADVLFYHSDHVCVVLSRP